MQPNQWTCRYCGRNLGSEFSCDCELSQKNKRLWNKQTRRWSKKKERMAVSVVKIKRKKYFYDTIEKENKDWHEHKNPLVRLFYKIKFGIAIKYADLRPRDLILDFGCGDSWLKKSLPEFYHNIVGYDIDPKLTEIKDYTKLKPDKIFALDVFEHIPKGEIRKIIRNFKKMNPNFELVTIIPTETWLWRKTRKIMGLSETVADHITKLEEILNILNKELVLVKKTNFLTFSHIAKWKN